MDLMVLLGLSHSDFIIGTGVLALPPLLNISHFAYISISFIFSFSSVITQNVHLLRSHIIMHRYIHAH